MGGLSVNIYSDASISTGDQSVEEGNLSVTFGLDGKRDVCINSPFYSCVLSDLALDCKRGWG